MTGHFTVVVDESGRPALWAGDTPPTGWSATGFRGSRQQCLEEVDRAFTTERVPDRTAGTDEDTLVALFRAAVAVDPDRVAVSDDRGELTYRALDAESDALAGRLHQAGVRLGDAVVVYLTPGRDVFVALLAVLKAGAAYVPVDVRYPDARRDLMVELSGARFAVTEPGRAEVLGGRDVVVVFPGPARGDEPVLPPLRVVSEDAACVLFTSGSSGAPKAVVLEHRNLVHFATSKSLPQLTATDRVGQVSSPSFDAFHFETWCALAAGAEIAVLPAIADLVADDLGRELRRRRITAMLAPTMVVNHVVHVDRDAFASLRVLHTGGDVLQPAAARALVSGTFTGVFCNLYGPTEGTTACTMHQIDSVESDAGSVPIGRELDGVAVYLLDDRLAEVPTGAVGELHIGGRGVARGYLGRPALTAERFRPDPFIPGGGRMYATGDLARRREDGVLEFLGRADDQVKVRGYRVEPGEAERVLARHGSVRDAAVVAVGDDQDRRLVALVVPLDGFSLKALREFAEREMPDYLVPTAFLQVDVIPATSHGKRDLSGLRRLAEDQLSRQSRAVPPRDEVERHLAALWEDLLGVERIGAEDDFFALGGNSMRAFRLHRILKRDRGVSVPVREILEVRTLAGLAALVRDQEQPR